ncbi:MAG: type II secretion system F family protein [archaeon]|nr:type II secretion system F family protein [archaeon]
MDESLDDKSKKRVFKGVVSHILKTYDKKSIYNVIAFGFVGIILLLVTSLFLSKVLSTLLTLIFTTISFLIIALPVIILQYSHYQKMKNIEANFPNFLKAISEGLNSNMSLPQAVRYAAKSDFGDLTFYINKLVAQLSWGLSFELALKNMALSINNKIIIRATSTIIAAHRSGGSIAKAISSIGDAVTDIDKLRRERISRISSQMLQGYIIFFVFIGVMIGLVVFLLPVLTTDMMGVGSDGVTGADYAAQYATRFKHLSIIQGFFSGISIGKLAEGSLSAGLKHAAIMSLIGYIALTVVTL